MSGAGESGGVDESDVSEFRVGEQDEAACKINSLRRSNDINTAEDNLSGSIRRRQKRWEANNGPGKKI